MGSVTTDELPLLVWHMNKLLPAHSDRDIPPRRLPLALDSFFPALADGLVLCKVLLRMYPNAVLARPVQTNIDQDTIREPGSKSQYKVSQNFQAFFETCRKYKLVFPDSLTVQDLLSGKQSTLLGVASHLVKLYILKTVSVLDFPELILLLNFDTENLQHLLDMDRVEILTRWVNYHMRRLKLPLRIQGIAGQHLKDCVAYLHILRKLAPKKVQEDQINAALQMPDLSGRAKILLQQMRLVGIEIPLVEADITEGSAMYHLKVLSCLFCFSTGITLPTGHIVHDLALQMVDLVQQLHNLHVHNPAAKAAEAAAASAAAAAAADEARRASEPPTRPLTPVDLTDAYEQLEQMKDRHSELEVLISQNANKVMYLQDITQKQQAIINDLEDEADEERRAFDDLLAMQKASQNKTDRLKKEIEAAHQKLAEIQAEIQRNSKAGGEAAPVQEPQVEDTSEDEVKVSKFITLTLQRRGDREKNQEDALTAQRIARVQLLQLAASLESLTGNEYPHSRKEVNVMDKLNWLVDEMYKVKETKQKKMQELVDNAKKSKQINDVMSGKIRVIAEELSKTPPSTCGRCGTPCKHCKK